MAETTARAGRIELKAYDGQIECGLVEVYELLNFSIHPLNRRIDSNHVNDFINIIREEGDTGIVLAAGEIIVNDYDGIILDGNHRYSAIIRAANEGLVSPHSKVRVMYEHHCSVEDEMARIVELNTHSRNWTLNDYIDSFYRWEQERGENGAYTKLRDFCVKHVLCYSCDMRTCATSPKYVYGATIIKGSRNSGALKKGALEISDGELELANTVHDELCQIRDRLGLQMQGSDIEGMTQVWWEKRGTIDLHDFLTHRPSKSVMRLPKGNKSEWLQVFLTIRNEQETGSKRAR